MYKELDFSKMSDEEANNAAFQCVDDMTFANMVYNVEDCGMRWEDLATIFGPDSVAAAQARYEIMKGLE